MWKRNLLFALFCGLGLCGLLAGIVPTKSSNGYVSDGSARSIDPVARDVDRAIEDAWSEENLVPSASADDLSVSRRLSLGLMGVVPSLAEIREFESYPADSRLTWWRDRVLADPRSHDYLAERFARSYVGVEDGPFLLFRRRRFVFWLAEEFAKDTPYDQIVRSMISEEGIWTSKPAINFITAAIKPDSEEYPDAKKLAIRVSRAFLATRLDCAECHDHPFAPWKQADFQNLAAYFGQTKRSLKGITDGGGEFQVESTMSVKLQSVSPAVPYQPELVPRDGSRRHRLAAWVTNRENKAFARSTANRAWAVLFGRPLVEPIDSIPQEEVPLALEILADDFIKHNFSLRRLLSIIASTDAFRRDSRSGDPERLLTEKHTQHFASFPMTRLRPEQVAGGLLQAASLETIDHQAGILQRAIRFFGEREFVERYGDTGADEFESRGGTIPQRLLLMNGTLLRERFQENPFPASSMRVAELAATDEKAVEVAMLCVLTRRPTSEETVYFTAHLTGTHGSKRQQRIEDLYWALLNSTEFSWNH